jgi:hypothetical protein
MRRIFTIFIICVLMTLACDLSQISIPGYPSSSPTSESTPQPPPETEPQVEITFRTQIPPGTPPDQPVLLKIMEEVSGLAFSAQMVEMKPDDADHYSVKLIFAAGSVIKYRYSRRAPNGEIQEHISDGRSVRYRMYYATNPGTVDDVISRWTDTQYQNPTARIQGQITDSTNGQPVPNLLVSAGGVQTLSASDGSFLIEGLPAGVHNLVVFSMDGTYNTFQQGAKVAADSTTPAQIFVSPAKLVNVVFTVKVPTNTIPAVPIRLAGNLYQLGNTFADLSGGVSSVATRMPTLTPLPDGRYSITLALPVGADIRYLYTIGDGIWNTELTPQGVVNRRQIIIPDRPTEIDDTIDSWLAEKATPITFDITVPTTTPPNDYISIQFHPVYGWTEPIPMWKLGENRWVFILNSPLKYIDSLSYRLCRNDQCGSADDSATMGESNAGLPLATGLSEHKIVGDVKSWAWLEANVNAVSVSSPQITPRNPGFWAGVEFLPEYHPNWSPLIPTILDDVQRIGVNWLVLNPTWTYTRENPPILEIMAGRDPLWNDLTNELDQASERGLQIALKPTANFLTSSNEFWLKGARDLSWWQVWFERYRNFVLHHADLAAKSGAQALILGGDWVIPALPNGTLPDKSPSGVPIDAEARWRMLLNEVKAHYGGPLFWSISYTQATTSPPPFLDYVDGIYLEWSEPLVAKGKTYQSQAELDKEAARIFDNGLIPLEARYKKPLILSVYYPSADGAATGCLPTADGNCLDLQLLERPNPDIATVQLDLQEQVDLYSSILSVVNQRNWINGFVSGGYYPPVILRDKSTSIHGKPTEELLAYWFTNLIPEESPP